MRENPKEGKEGGDIGEAEEEEEDKRKVETSEEKKWDPDELSRRRMKMDGPLDS